MKLLVTTYKLHAPFWPIWQNSWNHLCVVVVHRRLQWSFVLLQTDNVMSTWTQIPCLGLSRWFYLLDQLMQHLNASFLVEGIFLLKIERCHLKDIIDGGYLILSVLFSMREMGYHLWYILVLNICILSILCRSWIPCLDMGQLASNGHFMDIVRSWIKF